jgi:UDP-3-O-acyl-N-acetylglucosamine deacetylase
MNKKGLIGGILFFLGVLLIACMLLFTGIHIKTTDNGIHTGTITAIETNKMFPYIFETTAVYFKTDAQSSQEDVYCLIDKSLIPELSKLQKEKKQITIRYIDYLLPAMKECGFGNGIITEVEEENV